MFRVFISYSHDSTLHKDRVFALAQRLRRDAIEVVIDRDMGSGGPEEGWPIWSQAQVEKADRVLVACTENYSRRYDLNEAPGKGLGAVAEARIIRQLIYNAGGINKKFRVILFEDADNDQVPTDLEGYGRFLLYQTSGYADLLSWLKEGAPAPSEPEETTVDSWPVADPNYNWPLADRKNEFKFFEQMITGQSPQRIMLLEGVTNTGKTVCLAELLRYAKHLKMEGTLLDFKGCPSSEELFEGLLLDLGPKTLHRAYEANRNARSLELITDLLTRASPLLLIFDTYQQASEDSKKWLESQLLPRLDRAPALIVVIGGQNVPEQAKYSWNGLATSRVLRPIQSVDDWRELVAKKWQGTLLEDAHIEGVLAATEGDPGKTYATLESLVRQRERP